MKMLQDIANLRYTVWKNTDMDMSKSITKIGWLEEEDRNSWLWFIYKKDRIIASTRLSVHESIESFIDYSFYKGLEKYYPPPIASFKRLMVLNEYRGYKLGKYLDLARIRMARNMNLKSVALDCPEWRVAPLVKIGFKMLREPTPAPFCPSIKF